MAHVSTAEVRPSDALSFWRDYVCKTYVPVDFAGDKPQDFQASASMINLGQTRLTHVISSAAQYTRTRQNIKQSDSGEYLITLLTRGELQFEQKDRQVMMRQGDLCLFDTAQPYNLRFSTAYDAVHLKIPRKEFDQRLPNAERVCAMRVAPSGCYAKLASTMLQSTVELKGDTQHLQLAPALLDLVALAFDESFSDLAKDNSRYARIVARGQEYISAHLFDPNFDLSRVSTEIGVSSRTLSRAFAQMGITPSKWLWSKRLDAAHDMIRRNTGMSVSEVAMTCGFNDFSHFSRAFKAQFGATPSSMLN